MICENIEKYINMKNTPIDYDIVNETIDEMSIPDFGKATIREVVAIASRLEEKTGDGSSGIASCRCRSRS